MLMCMQYSCVLACRRYWWRSKRGEERRVEGEVSKVILLLVLLWCIEALKSILMQFRAGGRDRPTNHLISTLPWLLIWDSLSYKARKCLHFSDLPTSKTRLCRILAWQSLKKKSKNVWHLEKTNYNIIKPNQAYWKWKEIAFQPLKTVCWNLYPDQS